jgi:hypothetical protein
MSNFVVVHGSFHDGSHRAPVVERLEEVGQPQRFDDRVRDARAASRLAVRGCHTGGQPAG